jgi:hypothetical protein
MGRRRRQSSLKAKEAHSLRKMLKAGLSRFEPMPIEALAAAKARRQREPTAA